VPEIEAPASVVSVVEERSLLTLEFPVTKT
jgi:hypothetical protein